MNQLIGEELANSSLSLPYDRRWRRLLGGFQRIDPFGGKPLPRPNPARPEQFADASTEISEAFAEVCGIGDDRGISKADVMFGFVNFRLLLDKVGDLGAGECHRYLSASSFPSSVTHHCAAEVSHLLHG